MCKGGARCKHSDMGSLVRLRGHRPLMILSAWSSRAWPVTSGSSQLAMTALKNSPLEKMVACWNFDFHLWENLFSSLACFFAKAARSRIMRWDCSRINASVSNRLATFCVCVCACVCVFGTRYPSGTKKAGRSSACLRGGTRGGGREIGRHTYTYTHTHTCTHIHT